MKILILFVLTTATWAIATSACDAGPCTRDITRMQAQIDAGIEANASTQQFALESDAAKMHRQPTPESLAGAEGKQGDAAKLDQALAALDRAREADRAGRSKACRQALADTRRLLGR
ncbi:MAG TPA: hypothetical protein VHN11_22010 [Xanthobacteraceae bacterium]|nr:hypothetical protein [Xanthobacteraceae bacterium]